MNLGEQPPPGAHVAYSRLPPASAGTSHSASGLEAWDELRKEARKTETLLENRLTAYAKLTSSTGSYSGRRRASDIAQEQSRATEIQQALDHLSDVNSKMSSALSGSTDSRVHTLSRHRDILHDLSQDFRRVTSVLGAARDRADLLPASGESSPSGLSSQALSNSNMLLRERAPLQNSQAAVDDLIGHATNVAGALSDQRRTFEGISTKLEGVVTKFPGVNALLNAIRRKKSKDTLVLMGVVVACTVLLVLYWLMK